MKSVDVGERTPLWLSKRMWIVVACSVIAISVVVADNRHALVRFAVRTLGLQLDLGYTVRYVVPDGYRGVFIISEDTVNGSPPAMGGQGEFIYSIPESGHLVTTDTTPMMTMHKSEATYRSGKVIGNEGEPSEIRLRGITGFGSDGKARTLIGTHQEANDWWSNRKDWFRIERPDENERPEK